MEMKYIWGILIVLVLIGGAVGCNYVISDPNNSSKEEKTANSGNINPQNTTSVTQNQTNTTDNSKKDTKKAQAKTIKQTCTNCDGKGYTLCSACGGKGYTYIDCPDCDGGTVKIEGLVHIACETKKCETCGGSGKIKKACAACGGDGKIPCSACGGDGFNWVTVNQ